tara:strand:+ start:939 stop:1694 length:756 start_codon:yes stop_codon:yes gene_type:complete
MAISVDRVYQTVLALANKEQRGYITPQEFNLFANQAQNEIFEQYFYDLGQSRRMPGNSTVIGDPRDIIEDKITQHIQHLSNIALGVGTSSGVIPGTLTSNTALYFKVWVDFNNNGNFIECEKNHDYSKFLLYENSPLTKSTVKRPVVVLENAAGSSTTWRVYPKDSVTSQTKARLSYVVKPQPPNWTYVIVNNKPLYNSSASDHRDFTLHNSEERKLVLKILQLGGVNLKEYDVTQLAGAKEAVTIQQEKL